MIVKKDNDQFTVFDDSQTTSIFDGTQLVQVPTVVFTGTLDRAVNTLSGLQETNGQIQSGIQNYQNIINAISSYVEPTPVTQPVNQTDTSTDTTNTNG